jgi:hypothetical protein
MKLNQSLSTFAALLAVGAASAALPANAAGNLVANGSPDFSGAGAPTQWSFLNPAGEFWVSFDASPAQPSPALTAARTWASSARVLDRAVRRH